MEDPNIPIPATTEEVPATATKTKTVKGPAPRGLGDDLALAVLGVGLGWLGAILDRPVSREPSPQWRTSVETTELRLTFPMSPPRLSAGDLSDLLACVEGLWLAGMSLTGSEERPVWLPRHTVLPDGTVHRSPSPSRAGPEIVFVRYGSALDLLVAGGSVAAASATLLTLAVKADEIATRLFAIPEKIRTRRKQLRAEGARAEREEAEAVLDKARFEQETRRYRGGALTPAETQAFERLTVDLAAQDRTSEGRTTVLEQNFAQPDLVGPPPEFGDAEAAQVVQLRDRISEIAGPVDAQLTAPPTETG